MYQEPCIREILEKKLNEKNVQTTEILDIITDFVYRLENKELVREVFRKKAFTRMYELMPTTVPADEKSIEELLSVVRKISLSGQLKENDRKRFILTFAQVFAECSDNPEYCGNKIYVLITNMSGDDTIDMVREYNSWDEAEKDTENIYRGCKYDNYIAENMWYPISKWCKEKDWDSVKNFCTIVEFNAIGLEGARKYWEEGYANENPKDAVVTEKTNVPGVHIKENKKDEKEKNVKERNVVFGKMVAQLITAKSRFEVAYDVNQCDNDKQVLLFRAVDENICGSIDYPAEFVDDFVKQDLPIIQVANELIMKIEQIIASGCLAMPDEVKEKLNNLRIALLYKEDFVDASEEGEFAVVVVSEDEEDDDDGGETGLFATVVVLDEEGSEYEIVSKEVAEEWGVSIEKLEKIAFANSENDEYLVNAVFVNRETIEFLDDLEDYAEDLLGLDDDEDEGKNKDEKKDSEKEDE